MPESLTLLTGLSGLLLVFLNVLIEQIGFPVPATPILLLAGASGRTHLAWTLAVFVAATGACVTTDVGWYLAGRRYGNRVMRLVCRISLSPDSCVGDTQRRFERWGPNALVVAKFIPGLTVIAIPLAGAQRMSWAQFLTLTAIGSALWIAAPLLLGALAAPKIAMLVVLIGELGGRIALVAALLLAAYITFKWWQRRRFYTRLRMARVKVEELQAMMQREPPPVVLDVRSHGARALQPQAIPNSVYVPPEDVAARLATLDDRAEVVVYCTCPNEATAASVAKLLMRHGVTHVRPLLGGLDAWIAAGYPVTNVAITERVTLATLSAQS